MTPDLVTMLFNSPLLWIYTVVMLCLFAGGSAYAAERGRLRATEEVARRVAELKLEFDRRLGEHKSELDIALERAKRVSDVHVKKDYEFMEIVFAAILQCKYAFAQIRPLDALMDEVEFVCHIRDVNLRDRDDPDRDAPYPPTDACRAERQEALKRAIASNAPYIESVMARRPFIPPPIFEEIVSFWKMGADTANGILYPGLHCEISTPEQFEEKFTRISLLISRHFGVTRA